MRQSVLAHPVLAMVFGGFILCAETCLHFGDIVAPTSWTDLPLHDWIAGGLLLYGGASSRRDWSGGRALQASAWAFMASLLTAAVGGHWAEWISPTEPSSEWITAGGFLAILIVLLAISVGGMVATLRQRRVGN